MDPIQTTAARHIRPANKSKAEEIDNFYNDNACEALHDARRAMGQVAWLLHAAYVRARHGPWTKPKFASVARQA